MNVCPDCDRPLPQTATSCGCGWTLPTPIPKTQQEYLEQVLAEHTERAMKSLAEKGLDRKPGESVEDWRKRTLAYVKEMIRGIGRRAA